jgi:hypothetical protein
MTFRKVDFIGISFLYVKEWGLNVKHILLVGFLPKIKSEKISFKTPGLGALVRMW